MSSPCQFSWLYCGELNQRIIRFCLFQTQILCQERSWLGDGYAQRLGFLGLAEENNIALWANHLKGWCIFWNWPLSGLQDVEVCAGLLQSVSRGAAECVQGYRVCAGCSFNILPCSSRLNQKIFY